MVDVKKYSEQAWRVFLYKLWFFPRLIIYNNCALSADRLVSNQEIFRN